MVTLLSKYVVEFSRFNISVLLFVLFNPILKYVINYLNNCILVNNLATCLIYLNICLP